MFGEAPREFHGTQLIGRAPARPRHCSVSLPTKRSSRGVVAATAGASYRELTERAQGVPYRVTPDGEAVGDFLILERGPHAIGADQDDVIRLQLSPAAERHVRQDRVASDAALHEVAHRMVQRLL